MLDGVYPGEPERRVMIRTFSWWDREVPRRVVEKARPVTIRNGTLVVHTASTAWAQELSFHERDLLASVQRAVPGVKRIRIKVGPMPPPPPAPEPPPPPTIPLDVAELPAGVARALAHIGDDELRDVLTKAACTSLAPPGERPRRGRRGTLR